VSCGLNEVVVVCASCLLVPCPQAFALHLTDQRRRDARVQVVPSSVVSHTLGRCMLHKQNRGQVPGATAKQKYSGWETGGQGTEGKELPTGDRTGDNPE
jgi:hypothetical protein